MAKLLSVALDRLVLGPARAYNSALETSPLYTKSATSGVMYALGDVLAQCAQHYAEKKRHADEQMAAAVAAHAASAGHEPTADAHPPKAFRVDWTRAGVFFTFGTFIGGPAYHLWFGWLGPWCGVEL